MSTKRLSRTVIEGGRAYYSTFFRKRTHRVQRRREREYLRTLALSPELADAIPPPVHERMGRWHYDRLSAAERWLAHHAGRPWREVEGEILATFDTRSIAGRHIVFDHLLPPTWRHTPDGSWRVNRHFEFRVDADGLLVAEQVKRRPSPHRWRWRLEALESGQLSCEAARFTGERRVGLRGPHAYWLRPTEPDLTASIRRCRTYLGEPPRYRQGRPLTDAERAVYDALPAPDRIAITSTLE